MVMPLSTGQRNRLRCPVENNNTFRSFCQDLFLKALLCHDLSGGPGTSTAAPMELADRGLCGIAAVHGDAPP